MLARADELASTITELAPLTLDATKRGLRRLQAVTPLPDDHDLVEQCFGSADFNEGFRPSSKRKPDWKGVKPGSSQHRCETDGQRGFGLFRNLAYHSGPNKWQVQPSSQREITRWIFAHYIGGAWVADTDVTTNRNPANQDDIIGTYARGTATRDEMKRLRCPRCPTSLGAPARRYAMMFWKRPVR